MFQIPPPNLVYAQSTLSACSLPSSALELLKDLVGYDEVQESILVGLVGLLKGSDSGTVPVAVLGKCMCWMRLEWFDGSHSVTVS